MAKPVPAGYQIELHWCCADGTNGSYSKIDDVDAYTIDGNIVTVELSPELLNIKHPLFVYLRIHNADNTVRIHTHGVPLWIEQCWALTIDRNEICDPYIGAILTDETESQSTANITVSGINETFVTGIFLEYVLRPSKDNEPVLVSIEIGEFDLVNGHIYTITIPVVVDFNYRAVLHYVDQDGNAQTLEGFLVIRIPFPLNQRRRGRRSPATQFQTRTKGGAQRWITL